MAVARLFGCLVSFGLKGTRFSSARWVTEYFLSRRLQMFGNVRQTGPIQGRVHEKREPQTTSDATSPDIRLKYLLDTNACIALINGKPSNVRSRFQKAINAGDIVYVSSIAAFEVWSRKEHSKGNKPRPTA